MNWGIIGFSEIKRRGQSFPKLNSENIFYWKEEMMKVWIKSILLYIEDTRIKWDNICNTVPLHFTLFFTTVYSEIF